MDMTAEERAIMEQHIVYWKEHMDKGKIVVFGPVMDMRGPYGIGILKAANEEEVKTFTQNDPAATINSYEFFPMRAVLPNR